MALGVSKGVEIGGSVLGWALFAVVLLSAVANKRWRDQKRQRGADTLEKQPLYVSQ